MEIVRLVASRFIRGSRVFGLMSLKSRLSFIVMAVGVALLIVVLSIFNGFQKQVKQSLWEGGPHITIENSSENGSIPDYELLIDLFQKEPKIRERIESIEGNITSHGLLQNYSTFVPIMIRAVPVPSTEKLLSGDVPNFPKLTHYDRTELDQFANGKFAIIGKEMGALYHYTLGKDLTLTVPGGRFTVGRGVEVSVQTFRVAGFFKTGYYNYDSRFVFLSLPIAQEFFKLKGSVNQIAIKVKNIDDLKLVKSYILQTFHSEKTPESIREKYSLSVRTLAEDQENFLAALKLEKTIISIIVFLFIILAALGMVATVYSLVRAKRKSIGTLKALGLSSRNILLIFTLNSMVTGIFASIVGGVIGIFYASNLENIVSGLSAVINVIGHLTNPTYRDIELVPKDIYYFDHIPVDIDLSFIFMVTTAATILSGIAGYFPARWAANLNPVETIRNE